MSSNILKPKKALVGKMLAVVAVSSIFWGCTYEPYVITAEEQYTRNFIKDFGLVDQKQDWNLAKDATVMINLGPAVRKSVKVYGKHMGNFYLVADLTGLSGNIEVPVDLPKECNDILVVADGHKYYGNLGSTIDCADMSRGVPDVKYNDDGTPYNPNPALYTGTEGDYTVTVKHTDRGNGVATGYSTTDGGAYQYFNTQQMSPIISTTPWDRYYSINTQKWTEPNGKVGLLPESGVFNRLRKELTDWLAQKEREGESIVEDFRINTGDDGSFTIFPYYYGTNLKHELGVYLLDDKGNPIIKNGGTYDPKKMDYKLEDFVSFPVFQDRAPGDLQVQPHYDSHITGIRIMYNNNQVTNENPIEFKLGEKFNLQDYVEVEHEEDGWMSYDNYIKKYGKTSHSRVAYHFWIDERTKGEARPDSFARIDNNGIVTPLKPTKDHKDGKAYANVAIATALGKSSKFGAGIGRTTGKELNFSYVVNSGSGTGIESIEIAESELKMCVGYEKTLTVTLKDKDDNQLNLSDYWDKISVTEDWDKDKCHIYKDNASKTIRIAALAPGEFWPTVYLTTSGWNGICAYSHVKISYHNAEQEYTGPSDAMTLDNWQSKYFYYLEGYSKDVTENLIEADAEGVFISYSNKADGWGTRKLEKENFEGLDNTYRLRIKLDQAHELQIRSGWWNPALSYSYIVDDITYTSGGQDNCVTISAKEFEILLSDEVLDVIKEKGIAIQNNSSEGVTFETVEIERPAQNYWNANGKQEATNDLIKYYTDNGNPGTTCTICGQTVNLSNITPEVNIEDDADYDKIHYTVTWTQPAGQYTVSKHRPAARMRSRSVSRGDNDPGKEILDYDSNLGWKDVNSFWSRLLPHQEEVASYPPDICMLARSRGYDVIVKYNGKAWVGSLGMYLKVLGSYYVKGDKEEVAEDEYTAYTGKDSYVVFSQNRFNRDAQGNPSEQISALSVKHPASGRTFLTFEDMRLTRTDVNLANFWERSSDRDVNDLIFNITNYGDITNDEGKKITEVNDETISWLWAVEDLGATDDFDFNDMVMKITSVTKNVVTTDENGNETATTTMYKKVTFTPLCAGGTLPLYVHYNPNGIGEGGYTLRPGVFAEDNLGYEIKDGLSGQATPISELAGDGDDRAEIHSWFGVSNVKEMINTRSEDVRRAESCVIYLKKDFTIEGFGKNNSAKGSLGGLYVTVNDGRDVQYTNEITDGWTNADNEDSWVIKSPKEGSASQMFMIMDATTPWRWPRERTHILNPYPNFTEWVKDKDTPNKWYIPESGKEGYTIPRYDLKK